MTFSLDGTHIACGSDDVCKPSSYQYNATLVPSSWLDLSGSSNLLVWIPAHSRIGLWTPSTKLVIGTQQTKIQFHNCGHGEEWKNCYIYQ
ncbi:hypothetical protein B0H14DRAFT_2823538 [Mycena olivaceomarginata]|nr:hypothetical protein B0H14DRAFT_2823538 [Mycena olivaceomarginata]